MVAERRTASERLNTVDIDRVIEKSREHSHSVRAAADTGDNGVRQLTGHIEELLPRFDSDDALEITHHHRERVRADHGAYAVNRVLIFLHICVKGGVNRFFEGHKPVCHLDDICAEYLHSRDVRSLLFNIDRAHINVALKPEISRRGGKRNAVLTRSGLGDNLFLAHVFRQQRLAHAVVQLVRAGVVEVLALYVKLYVSEG